MTHRCTGVVLVPGNSNPVSGIVELAPGNFKSTWLEVTFRHVVTPSAHSLDELLAPFESNTTFSISTNSPTTNTNTSAISSGLRGAGGLMVLGANLTAAAVNATRSGACSEAAALELALHLLAHLQIQGQGLRGPFAFVFAQPGCLVCTLLWPFALITHNSCLVLSPSIVQKRS